MNEHLDDMLDFANNLPSLPSVVAEAIRLLGDESADNDEIAAVLQRDQALVAQLLKLANSAYYGVSRRVSTVRQAILVLGRKAVRGLVIAAGAYDLMARPQEGYWLDQGLLWDHCLAAGYAASLLANRVGYKPADEAFVAGLLHDIGKVVLSSYLAEQRDELLAQMEQDQDASFLEIEAALLHIDHATLGGMLVEHWHLPERLAHSIRFHHHPMDAGDDWQLAAIVHCANALALTLGIGLGVDGLAYFFDDAAVMRLGLGNDDLDEVAAELVDQVCQAQLF